MGPQVTKSPLQFTKTSLSTARLYHHLRYTGIAKTSRNIKLREVSYGNQSNLRHTLSI